MKELNIEAKTEALDTVRDFLHGEIDEFGCKSKTVMQLDIAVEEIFVNICNYAYGGDGSASLRIETEENPSAVKITFIDSGIPYNPLENENPDITLPIEQREIGGLGIFMVKETMDDISYEYTNGKNILTIKKYI